MKKIANIKFSKKCGGRVLRALPLALLSWSSIVCQSRFSSYVHHLWTIKHFAEMCDEFPLVPVGNCLTQELLTNLKPECCVSGHWYIYRENYSFFYSSLRKVPPFWLWSTYVKSIKLGLLTSGVPQVHYRNEWVICNDLAMPARPLPVRNSSFVGGEKVY